MSQASKHQPDPAGDGKTVLNYVLADLVERAQDGKKRYGTFLRTHNGRNALWDALQENYDLVMYLRQFIVEHEEETTQLDELYNTIWNAKIDPQNIEKALETIRVILRHRGIQAK